MLVRGRALRPPGGRGAGGLGHSSCQLAPASIWLQMNMCSFHVDAHGSAGNYDGDDEMRSPDSVDMTFCPSGKGCVPRCTYLCNASASMIGVVTKETFSTTRKTWGLHVQTSNLSSSSITLVYPQMYKNGDVATFVQVVLSTIHRILRNAC